MAGKAEEVASILEPAERPVLVAAAYLHDIGYAPAIRRTGVHQLDGAAFVRRAGHERLACLVAHHSESRFEIGLKGLSDALEDYAREESEVSDALTFCDLTTGPAGEDMTLQARCAEVGARYGGDSVITTALEAARPNLAAAIFRTRRRLQRAA